MKKNINSLDDTTQAIPQRSPAKPKKKLEKDIQREICDWLASKGFFFWRYNAVPVYEKGHFRALPKYSPRGLPDIMILNKGHFIGIEVKVPDYWKFTADQEKMQGLIIANGGNYHIATSLLEVQELIQSLFPI